MLHIHKILHPHDFSPHANYAFEMACSLARDHGARVLVLHVNPLPPPALMPYAVETMVPEEESTLAANLRNLHSPFPSVEVEHMVVTGDVVPDILRIAQEEGCDLIVMGTHGRKGLDRLLMGSVADRVTRRAPCPVVTVRNPTAFEEVGQPALAAHAVR
jgi:nucleotide-binding universal stress UspA family protein